MTHNDIWLDVLAGTAHPNDPDTQKAAVLRKTKATVPPHG